MPDCDRCAAAVIQVELDEQPGRRILLDTDASSWYALVIHRGVGQEHARPIFAYQEHRCGDLQELAKLAPLNPAQLDDLVHERKGEEAAAIDNGGKVAQLVYLIGVRPDAAARFLKAHGLEANGG